ncbi:putative sulfate exporter family transporter [Shimia sp. R11_0]|uniref:YeiH family protein n=1 Tax=Shimia sp. R11_0 TaxID=2821096 RepID=UPI001ADA1A4F|nr:putative sulfate exporter family transporter [Shimia sp. R11_0]MBO9476444.1 putative sulfate exporter family transporter [Shimia sp. R11_0]
MRIKEAFHKNFPGVAVAITVAATAQLLSEHHGAPAMLLALLFGIALNFLGEEGRTVAGVGFSARTLLRIGVALLGVRISAMSVMALGWSLIALTILGVATTIGFGLFIARFLGHKWRFATLTAGSVAICGASAAMAIAAILPKDDRSEERLLFTVMGVTVMSTIAMIAYPAIVTQLELGDQMAGVFLGGTIHDVAQVAGAGFSISQEVGDTAVLVKLIRVSMLAPVVLIASLLIRSLVKTPTTGERPPILPGFVLGFLALATLNTFGAIPAPICDLLSDMSRYFLLTAVAAVGMKTNLKQVLGVGGAAIALIIVETLFIAGFILAGIYLLT